MVRTRAFAVLCLAGLAVSCGSRAALQPTAPGFTGAQVAANYLNELVDTIAANSFKRQQIDWTVFRASVLKAGEGAQSIAETGPAILHALTLLADGHSSYTATNGVGQFFRVRTCAASGAPKPDVPSDIGYVKVTASSASGAAATAFADSIQAQIQTGDRDGLAGWIVDLRGNGGGNMWPMLAGLNSLFGDSVVGHFIFPSGATSNWEIRGNSSFSGGFLSASTSSAYTLRRPAPRIAVLVDNGVASSGEATFIAFRQRANTRSFGVATCGLSTSVAVFSMSDAATLRLATGLMADRNRLPFGEQVAPNEVVSDPVNEAVSRAVAWLRGN